MQLENSFTVPVPVDEAWRVLLDIERIAPCMPGAALDSVTGDDFTGRVKVKLGPINLTYQGKASFVEKDEAAHRAVIDARGKDQRGNGTAAATITAKLLAEGQVTRVDVLTDLNITGRPAQFGRGVMTDVGNKLLGQFADKLAAQLGEGDAQGDADRAGSATTGAVAGAAATATGVAEEVAQSVEQTPGDNAVAEAVRSAGTKAREAAASATDSLTADADTVAASPPTRPISPVGATDTSPVPAVADTAPSSSGTPAAPSAGRAPSAPPSGNTAPPGRPATGAPPRSTPSAAPRPQPAAEPEPIDLLEVAGGAAMARYAAPGAAVAAVLLLVVLAFRRRHR
ncbi:SRPBCC family protein [Geodermatophilus sp. FMUSA9-8]|uniref:SRPBCC family protein n=1 Tax=Geodermatophilus sp. FMUSA9-8 TaxID=3120155 RepID=UPI00300A4CD8